MSNQKWEPGAIAAIVISEHFENMNRVVVLVENFEPTLGHQACWGVKDGKLFKGYKPGTARDTPMNQREYVYRRG